MRLRHKLIFFISLLFIFAQLTSAANYYQYCVDTDNGLKYDTSGKVYISYNKNPAEIEKQGVPDVCHQGGAVVQSCTGSNCYIGEYACVKGSGEYWDIQYDSKRCMDLGYTGCAEGACAGKPVVETCSDSKKNQDEADIDCGGVCGATCNIGQRCNSARDCKTGVCGENTCKEAVKIEPYCLDEDNGNSNTNAKLKFGYYEYDGRWNEGYVTEDCVAGDSIVIRCEANTNGGCFVREAVCDSSQQSKYTFKKVSCTYGCENGACKSAPQTLICSDGIKNQDESDVDCGGICGRTCSTGKRCITSADCVSFVCSNGLCAEAVQNRPTYCNDDDGINLNLKAKVSFGYTYEGRYIEGIEWDYCSLGDTRVSSCSSGGSEVCYVGEYQCDNSRSVPLKSVLTPCANGCRDGVCTTTRIIVTTDDSSGRQATAVPVEEAQPVQVQADARHVTVRTDDYANQATPVQVEEDQPVVVQAEPPAAREDVAVLQTEQEETEQSSWFGRIRNFFGNALRGRQQSEERNDAGRFGSALIPNETLCERTDIIGELTPTRLCNLIYGTGNTIRTIREELTQRITDLENAVYNLRQTEVKRIAKQEIKEQLSGFLASCESRWTEENGLRAILENWRWGGRDYFKRNYGDCKTYCEQAERKTCLTSVVNFHIKIKKSPAAIQRAIDDACREAIGEAACTFGEGLAEEHGLREEDKYKYYPVYRSVGCGYEYSEDTYAGIHCMCCSFPSE